MRCLEAAFVILLGWVFSFRKYRSSFRKIKLFILQIIDFQFVSSCFVSKITVGSRPPLRKNQEEKKARFKWWHENNWSKAACRRWTRTLKCWGRPTSKHPTTFCGLFQKRLVLFASLLQCINGTVLPFFFPLPPSLNWYPPSHKLLFSLPHWISRKFRLFSLTRHFILFTDESDFLLSLVLAT